MRLLPTVVRLMKLYCSDIYFIIYILGPLITDCEMRIGF